MQSDDTETVARALRAFRAMSGSYRRGGAEPQHRLAIEAQSAFERIINAQKPEQLELGEMMKKIVPPP